MWLLQAASEIIRTSIEPVLEQYKSAILSSFKFSKLNLGTVAPQFTGGALWILVWKIMQFFDRFYIWLDDHLINHDFQKPYIYWPKISCSIEAESTWQWMHIKLKLYSSNYNEPLVLLHDMFFLFFKLYIGVTEDYIMLFRLITCTYKIINHFHCRTLSIVLFIVDIVNIVTDSSRFIPWKRYLEIAYWKCVMTCTSISYCTHPISYFMELHIFLLL